MSTTLTLGLTEQGRITSSPATANTGPAGPTTTNCSVTRERADLNYILKVFIYSVVPETVLFKSILFTMMNTLPDLESVIPLTTRRVKQINIFETDPKKENMKKEKTFHVSKHASCRRMTN